MGRRPDRRFDRALDTTLDQMDSWVVRPRSLTVSDARGQGASLRVTRHPEQGKVVVSHWRDDLCVASTPIEVGELPALIGVLADALGDAVRSIDRAPNDAVQRRRLLDAIKQWLRPHLAQIIDLRPLRQETENKGAG
jgi:hypothetical protein